MSGKTQQMQQAAADAAAAVSTAAGSTVAFTDWLQGWMEIGAAGVAIIAGLAAAWYHVDKVLWARKVRRLTGRDPRDPEQTPTPPRADDESTP